jgi:hypothetical protein
MVSDSIIRAEAAQVVASQSLVAVFSAGTGIGAYTLRALATNCAAKGGKSLRAYIIGRKPERAKALISDLRGIFPAGDYHFVKTDDLSLIKDVDRACAEIIKLEEKHGKDARIDYLMLSHGGAVFLPRKGRSFCY